MQKLSAKIAIMLFAVLTTIIAALFTLLFLINSGKLTNRIEQWIERDTHFDFKVKDIHLNIFSGLRLKQLSVKGYSDQKQFTVECNTVTIRYTLLNLLKRRIKSIDLSGVQITLNAKGEKTVNSSSPYDSASMPFTLKDVYRKPLSVENVFLDITKANIMAGDFVFTLTGSRIQAKEIQSSHSFDISMNGNFTTSNLPIGTIANLHGEVCIKTKYHLPDDELTILDHSYFLLNNSEKLSINGKAYSLLSSPEITCNISGISSSGILQTFIPKKYKTWLYNGNISMNTAIAYTGKSQSHNIAIATNLLLTDLGFASPEYDYFAEGINGRITMNMKIDRKFKNISYDISGALEPFLWQLREFTTDMKKRETHLSLSGSYEIQKNNLLGAKGVLSWNKLGTITTSGNILNITGNPCFDINMDLKKFDNAACFETFVKDTIEYSNPVLFTAQVEGETNAHFSLNGFKENLVIDGRLDVKDLSLLCGNFSLNNATIDLPFSLEYSRSGTPIQKQDIPEKQYGTIRFKKLSYGPLEIEDIRINPVIISNSFFIKDPFTIPVFGGMTDIRNISVKNVMNNDRTFTLEFQLNNICLKALTTAYKLTPFEGTLSSSLMSFRGKGQKLYSNDEIQIKLFGGEITINDLSINNFLDPLAEIGFSAEVNHLDLGQMSDTYRNWGNITGIINGNVRDFTIVAGEPSRFEIEMKTETNPDIKQIVSTKFLKNFVPGIGKVLDKVGFTNYKYAVMGLHARLKNDYITLRGAVREEGKELFMKGTGMKRLEIVFPNADKRVPFKKFLHSLKGVLRSDFKSTKGF